jgi:hypothetical protein
VQVPEPLECDYWNLPAANHVLVLSLQGSEGLIVNDVDKDPSREDKEGDPGAWVVIGLDDKDDDPDDWVVISEPGDAAVDENKQGDERDVEDGADEKDSYSRQMQ